jgi:hypothetical protein
MEYDTGEKYLKEIDHVSVLETVDERFNGISALMTKNAVLYGSTVTGLLTGLPIVGDLDIAVSTNEYRSMIGNVAGSVKWIQTDGKTVSEKMSWRPSGHDLVSGSNPGGLVPSSEKKSYAEIKHLPVSNVVTFETINEARVQVMESKTQTGDTLEDSLEIVRKVDFIFCGLAIDRYGRVLEVLPNAYEDCIQRVIRMSEYNPEMSSERLQARITKYMARGYSLATSIDEIMRKLANTRGDYMRAQAAKGKDKKKRTLKTQTPGFRYKLDTKAGTVILVSSAVVHIVGSKGSIRDIFNSFASRDYGSKIVYENTPSGGMRFWRNKTGLDVRMAQELMSNVYNYLAARHNLSHERLMSFQSMEKKKRATYGAPKGYKEYVSGGAVTGRTSSGRSFSYPSALLKDS